MVRKTPLRAVSPDERSDPRPPLTLAEAVAGGDYLQILLAQRREIAESIPDEKGPAKAALHRQLSLIAKEIEGIEARVHEEAADADAEAEDEAWDEAAI